MRELAVSTRDYSWRVREMSHCLEVARDIHWLQLCAVHGRVRESQPMEQRRLTPSEVIIMARLLRCKMRTSVEKMHMRLCTLYLRALRTGNVRGNLYIGLEGT